MLLLCKSAIAVHFTLCILNIAGMLVDGLTIEDISGGGHGDTTPPKILKRKQEEKEEEKEEEGERDRSCKKN